MAVLCDMTVFALAPHWTAAKPLVLNTNLTLVRLVAASRAARLASLASARGGCERRCVPREGAAWTVPGL